MARLSAQPESPDLLADLDDEVFLWRRAQFLELGLDELEAVELAASTADLAQARFVLGNGCSPQLALRILR